MNDRVSLLIDQAAQAAAEDIAFVVSEECRKRRIRIDDGAYVKLRDWLLDNLHMEIR